jgi:hypothetical protein
MQTETTVKAPVNKTQIFILKAMLADEAEAQTEAKLVYNTFILTHQEQSSADYKMYDRACLIQGLEIAINYLYGSKFSRGGKVFLQDIHTRTNGTTEALNAHSLHNHRQYKQTRAIRYASSALGMTFQSLLTSLREREESV